MHPLLANILEEVDKGQTIEATYDSLVDAFKDNYNPLKGETARSEMERWLSKTESVFAMHNKVSFDGFSVRFWKTSEDIIVENDYTFIGIHARRKMYTQQEDCSIRVTDVVKIDSSLRSE